MNVSHEQADSPSITSALRYERVAQLEAVLNLRDQRQRARLRVALITGAAVLGLFSTATLLILRGVS
ncbi:MAG: hypothetical protein WAO83_03525 [Fuerstiella sp.]